MAEQLLELGVLIVLALACGGIGLVGGRYLTEKVGCCNDGGDHGHAPPPEPPGGEERNRPLVLSRLYVPVTKLRQGGPQLQDTHTANDARYSSILACRDGVETAQEDRPLSPSMSRSTAASGPRG